MGKRTLRYIDKQKSPAGKAASPRTGFGGSADPRRSPLQKISPTSAKKKSTKVASKKPQAKTLPWKKESKPTKPVRKPKKGRGKA